MTGTDAVSVSVVEVVDLDTLKSEARALARDGFTPAEAAMQVLDRYSPDPPATERLLRHGLTMMVAGRVTTPGRPAVVGVVSYPMALSDNMLTVAAATGTGEMKPWARWNLADWRSWHDFCVTQTDGWFDRQEGAQQIIDLLVEHKVEQIADLPPAAWKAARKLVGGFQT